MQKERVFFMNRPIHDPAQMEGLLQTVSAKLGVPAAQLRDDLKAGRFDAAIARLRPDEAAKLRQAIRDPKTVEKLMSTPQAQALYQKLTGRR